MFCTPEIHVFSLNWIVITVFFNKKLQAQKPTDFDLNVCALILVSFTTELALLRLKGVHVLRVVSNTDKKYCNNSSNSANTVNFGEILQC